MNNDFDVLLAFRRSVEQYPQRMAFFIQKESFTYLEFAQRVSAIRKILRKTLGKKKQQVVGVATWDSIASYAAIYALWFEGHVFLPISPRNPASRNKSIVEQAECNYVLTAQEIPVSMLNLDGLEVIETGSLTANKTDLVPVSSDPADLLYLIFTSGSTGIPKGVMLNRDNFNAYLSSFLSLGYSFTADDRFLQIFDLTFDASLQCYAAPLSIGASVYTVPWNEVKYMYALKLMREHDLTFAKMTPSTISFLRPYFSSIRLDKLRYCLFGGEALQAELVNEWAACVPNARIQNVYGPTEASINCLEFPFDPHHVKDKSFHGILSIGKAFGDTTAIIANESGELLDPGKKGELCVAGRQITPGYWKDPERNERAFFNKTIGRKKLRFYRTGDLCFMDKDGDFMYCGRIDNQVQIQGFRVELGEIEACAHSVVKGNVAAIARENFLGTLQIYLFTEKNVNKEKLLTSLKSRLPDYMVPSDIILLDAFPVNVSGKIDRKAIQEILK
jgi:D-alanine--poly(phosphoribitol) ligase subunit 1